MKTLRRAAAATIVAGALLAGSAGPSGASGTRVGATIVCDGTVTVTASKRIVNVHIIQSTPDGEVRTVVRFRAPRPFEYVFDADQYPGFIGVNVLAGGNAQPGYPDKGAWVPVAPPTGCDPGPGG